MRIATANAFDAGIDTLSRRQAELSALQEQLTTGKRVAAPATIRRRRRAPSGRWQRRPQRDQPARGRREPRPDDTGREHARRRRRPAAARARADGRRPATAATATPSARASPTSCSRCATSCFARQPRRRRRHLSVRRPGRDAEALRRCPGRRAVRRRRRRDARPSRDRRCRSRPTARRLAEARTGNGVFVTSAAPGVLNATIDAASVADPSALTGADYTLQFSVAGGVDDVRGAEGRRCRRRSSPRPTSRGRRSRSTA